MGKTIAEKILSQKSHVDAYANDFVVANLDLTLSHDGNRPLAVEVFQQMGLTKVWDARKNIQILDHAPCKPSDNYAQKQQILRNFAREQGVRFHDLGDGACHQLLPEKGYVAPGELVVGTDSHTCTYGALNVFSTGIGSSDMACAMACGKLWFRVPETIKIVLTGSIPAGVYAKDIILYLIGMIGANGANYKAVEFTGPVISALSVEERLTISNMAIEMGAKAGLMEADEKTIGWLVGRVGRPYTCVRADADAKYCRVVQVDVSAITPQIARPHRVDNVCSVDEIGDVPVSEAILGTCTNGRLSDLRVGAAMIKGRHVHPDTRLFVIPASRQVYLDAMREGLLETFVAAGAVIGVPGCSGCSGGASVGVPASGENVITTANRNFKGRLGNSEGFLYLASPATVVASAMTGRITDCRNWL